MVEEKEYIKFTFEEGSKVSIERHCHSKNIFRTYVALVKMVEELKKERESGKED